MAASRRPPQGLPRTRPQSRGVSLSRGLRLWIGKCSLLGVALVHAWVPLSPWRQRRVGVPQHGLATLRVSNNRDAEAPLGTLNGSSLAGSEEPKRARRGSWGQARPSAWAHGWTHGS